MIHYFKVEFYFYFYFIFFYNIFFQDLSILYDQTYLRDHRVLLLFYFS